MIKIEDWNDFPTIARNNALEVASMVIDQIGGGFEFFKPDTGSTVTFVWTGPMPNKEDETLTISQRAKGSTLLFENGHKIIAKAILAKYDAAAKVTEVVVPQTEQVTLTSSNFDEEKRQAFELAKAMLSSFGYVAVPKDIYKDLSDTLKVMDDYLKEEFPDMPPEERAPYAQTLKRILREFKAFDKIIFCKIEDLIHSV